MDVERLTTWQKIRDGTRPPPPSSSQVLADLRKAVDDATGLLRALTFTYLAVWAYIVIAAGSVTHRQLLIGTSIELPLLGTGVDLVTFFWLAPALFLVVHANVLLQLYLLARRVRRFDEAARRLRNAEQEAHARSLLTPFPFVEWRAGRETAQAMHGVFALVNWALYIVLPLFLLLFVQFKFLPYQHDTITPFHVVLIIVDLALLWLVWPRINHAQGGWWRGVEELWRGRVSRWMLFVSPLLSLACVLAGVLLWFDQRPDRIAWLEAYIGRVLLPRWEWLFTRERLEELDKKQQPPSLTALLEYRWSRIGVPNAILMRREPAPEIVAQFRREAGQGKEEEGERRAYLDEELAEPINLAGRNFRRANLARSKLWRVRLGNADLRNAFLTRAHLQGAILSETQLQGVILSEAQLQGADLTNAQLRGANLANAQLQDADLTRAQLQGASLSEARLQGADLRDAQLQGAYLGNARLRGAILANAQLQDAMLLRADLQGANLAQAELQGVSFSEAQLQGADLSEARLQGADLTRAQLQGADLAWAKLQGAYLGEAELQGANLTGAELQGTYLYRTRLQGANLAYAQLQGAYLHAAELFLVGTNSNTNFSRADLRSARSDPLTPKERAALNAAVEQAITDPEVRARVLGRLAAVLSDTSSEWRPEELPENKRRDVIISTEPGAIRMLMGKDTEVFLSQRSDDDKKYGEALADELGQLACRMSYNRAVEHFVRRMNAFDRGAYLPEFARQLRLRCPDVIDKLNERDQKVLTKVGTAATMSMP